MPDKDTDLCEPQKPTNRTNLSTSYAWARTKRSVKKCSRISNGQVNLFFFLSLFKANSLVYFTYLDSTIQHWINVAIEPQSNKLPVSRGTTELVQHFRLSYRRKSAAWHKFDMVWLYRSPIPMGRRGYFTLSTDFYLPSLRLEGRGSAHCWTQECWKISLSCQPLGDMLHSTRWQKHCNRLKTKCSIFSI